MHFVGEGAANEEQDQQDQLHVTNHQLLSAVVLRMCPLGQTSGDELKQHVEPNDAAVDEAMVALQVNISD